MDDESDSAGAEGSLGAGITEPSTMPAEPGSPVVSPGSPVMDPGSPVMSSSSPVMEPVSPALEMQQLQQEMIAEEYAVEQEMAQAYGPDLGSPTLQTEQQHASLP